MQVIQWIEDRHNPNAPLRFDHVLSDEEYRDLPNRRQRADTRLVCDMDIMTMGKCDCVGDAPLLTILKESGLDFDGVYRCVSCGRRSTVSMQLSNIEDAFVVPSNVEKARRLLAELAELRKEDQATVAEAGEKSNYCPDDC